MNNYTYMNNATNSVALPQMIKSKPENNREYLFKAFNNCNLIAIFEYVKGYTFQIYHF